MDRYFLYRVNGILLKLVAFVAILSLEPIHQAYAGTISIISESSWRVDQEADKIILTGAHILKNLGNQTASKVSASFQLGRHRFSGAQHEIASNGSEQDFVREEISLEDLGPSSWPKNGLFPLFIIHNYFDHNGYQFSVPQVELIAIGNSEQLNPHATISSKFECEPNYKCKLSITNLSSHAKQLTVQLFSGKELSLSNDRYELDLPANQTKLIEQQIENISGLANSVYAVHAVIQWVEESGATSLALVESSELKIQSPSRTANHIRFLLVVVGILLIELLAFWLFVLHQAKNSATQCKPTSSA